MTTHYKLCNCNRTLPLDAQSGAKLGAALGNGTLAVASHLCRHQAGAGPVDAHGADRLVVACTQEQERFAELSRQQPSAAPVRFVNLRETGGWSAQGAQALPKMAALLADAALPDPEPVPTVEYESGGKLLLIGAPARVLPWAKRLASQLKVSVLLTSRDDSAALLEPAYRAFSGSQVRIEGWLGAFRVSWRQTNPIDLERCVRCNACIAACPENAIDLNYQVDIDACTSHRACVTACGSIGAIDFARADTERSGEFDLIFDLSDQPLITLHQPPQGYFAPGADPLTQAEQALQLAQMVGRFSKPKFFQYKERLCAHGRNRKIGCNACIDVCSTDAISHDGDRVQVNPYLCAGCGACTTVCPSGAMRYAYPRAPDLGMRIQTMLAAYAKAGGAQPALLLHSLEQGAELVNQLGRLAGAGVLQGMPARVIPLGLHHVLSAGIDVWLAAIAYGAANVLVLTTDEEAPHYLDALEQQMAIAQTILAELGYAGRHLAVLRARGALELDEELRRIPAAQAPAQAALFHVAADKRNTLDFVFDHLLKHAPAAKDNITLPPGAPFGALRVDTDACTLCMSCVGACPEAALADNPSLPQLRFIERNCVQCGLCAKTCPENAIALEPRLLLSAAAKQPVVLNETQPYHCIRCGKPFGTLRMIENMMAKLSLHGAFAGNMERLKMCGDCRVIDMMESKREITVHELKR